MIWRKPHSGCEPISVTDLDTLSSGLRSIYIWSQYLRQRQSVRISTIRGVGQWFSKKISTIGGSDSTYSVVLDMWKPSDVGKNLLEALSEIFPFVEIGASIRNLCMDGRIPLP